MGTNVGQETPATPGGPVQVTTRILGGIIAPFLVAAWVILYLVPERSAALFAWPIGPPMTSMLLGGIYLGGAWFFVRVVAARRWEQIRLGFLPVAGFASLMGIATVIHWDLFTHGHPAFVTWAVLYFTTPFLVLAVWWRNERAARQHPSPGGSEPALTPRARVVAGIVGAVAVVIGLALFAWPEQLLQAWPWSLSQLTGRVVGAISVLGGAGLGMARWPAWRSARLLVQVVWVMLASTIVAALRARDNLDGGPLTWVFVAWLVLVGAASVVLYRRMDQLPPVMVGEEPT